MQEKQVTASTRCSSCPRPFVLATQTPEQEGTYRCRKRSWTVLCSISWPIIPMLTKKRRLLWRRRVGARLNCAGIKRRGFSPPARVVRICRSVRMSSNRTRLVRMTRPKDQRRRSSSVTTSIAALYSRAAQCLIPGRRPVAICGGCVAALTKSCAAGARHRLFNNFTADSEGITPDDPCCLLKRCRAPWQTTQK